MSSREAVGVVESRPVLAGPLYRRGRVAVEEALSRLAALDRLRNHRVTGPVLLLVAAAGYLGLTEYGLWLNQPVNLGAGFWPAAGFSLALLTFVHPSRWGWVLAGVVVADLGGGLARGYPLDAALWWTAGNIIEPLVGAMLLRLWGNPAGLLVPLPQLLRFFGAAVVVGPVVGATIGTIGTVVAVGHEGLWEVWPKYVVGDALGVLVVAPLLLCWKEPSIARHRGETIALAAALLAVSMVSFRTWGQVWDPALPYLVTPLLMWAALRHGCRGAALGVFATTQIASSFTSTGHGLFASAGAATGHAIILLQIFLVITAVSTFIVAALVEDLVDRAEVEDRLERQASTDELTGLANRSLLTSSLSERSASPRHGSVGVCVCDLDYFKVVNDGLGHHAGDEVLVEVARRMSDSVRPTDLVGRLGGDEFVIVVDGDSDQVEELARRVILAVATPMTLSDGTKLTPSISVGMAHGKADADHSTLLRDADAALYRAKELGRGRFHRFDDQLRLRVADRLFIQTEVLDALGNDALYCVYQPEICIATGEVFSFEALSRWDHPTRGPISPDRFIPVIEDIGASGRLFDHVLEETLTAQSQWARLLGFRPAVAVNLSAGQLADDELPGAVAKALARAGAPADSLWLEVTESALAEDTASRNLHDLHDLGVRLAIDDFGTGWSSMERLAAFPWDLLKIDKSFVQALGEPNHFAEYVVNSTIALAHALGIPTTAEGVETPEQLARLAQLGCDIAQGHLLARPAPAREAITHVTADAQWTGPGIPAAHHPARQAAHHPARHPARHPTTTTDPSKDATTDATMRTRDERRSVSDRA